jgi:hypothetical protein
MVSKEEKGSLCALAKEQAVHNCILLGLQKSLVAIG